MRMRSMVASGMLAVLAGTNAGAQAAHPNFAGVWILDASRNAVQGQLGAPTSATYTITQHGDTIVGDRVAETTETGTIKSHVVWGLDGKAWKNKIPVGDTETEISSVLSWNQATLVIRTSLTVQETPVDQVDEWSLSADGKTLTMQRSVAAMGQDIGSSTLVFVKKN